MSLSKDIQQREFRSEYQKAMLNIMYTHNFLITEMSDLFKGFDITRQQFNVLRILRGQYPNPASINLIKDRMLDKMSDTSRIVERLRLKGLLTRADALRDKRLAEIMISPAGMELLDKMEKPVITFESRLHNLSVQEAKQLNYLLDKLRDNSEHDLSEENEALELMNPQEKF
jgi:DNA-binding MarR family transcriptional regulator